MPNNISMNKRKLKIIVIGYYGKLNAGDDLLQQSICNIFQDHDLLFTSWFPGTDFLNMADLIVVGGGSIWPGNPFFQNGVKIAQQLRKPFVVLGISAKTSNPSVLKQTLPLIENALYFQVRDADTKEILGNDSRIIVGPDLYWWSPHQVPINHQTQFNGTIALNLRSWEELNWSPEDILRSVNEIAHTVLPYPFYFGSLTHEHQGNLQDVTLLESIGIKEVPKSFTLNSLEKSSITIAMRFHALLVSLRCGVPIIGFNYHKKTQSLFNAIDMPELCIPLNDSLALRRAIQRVVDNYPEYKARTVAISERYLTESAHQRETLNSIVSSICPITEPFSYKAGRILKRYLYR